MSAALENGKYGQIEFPLATESAEPESTTPRFESLGELRFAESPCSEDAFEPSPALGDYDSDGLIDIFVSNPCGANRLFRNEGGGRLTDVTRQVGLEGSRRGVQALFVNYDNSNAPSLVVLGRENGRLYKNENGRFSDVTGKTELDRVNATPVASLDSFDFDNDGQLDLFMTGTNESKNLRLLRNNGDGTFQDVSKEAGLEAHAGKPSRGSAFADFNEDGFLDLLVVTDEARALVFTNAGDGAFRLSTIRLGDGPTGQRAARVKVGDFNHDGWFDAFVLDEKGYSFLINKNGQLAPSSSHRALPLHPERWAISMDADANGRSDILLRKANGDFLLVTHAPTDELAEAPIEIPETASGFSAWADLEGQGSTDILAVGNDGVMRLFRRVSPTSTPWLAVRLEGLHSSRQAMGVVLEIKAGLSYQKHLVQGLPLTVYTDDRKKIDVVRVTWSNGVIQNEVDVEANKSLVMVEAERQTSSCPFLYIWNGRGFKFLTDVLGRAPLGEPLPIGGFVEPNPEDFVRIPPDSMALRDGRYVFQITEELKEIAYIDAVELVAVEHRTGSEVYTNERFANPPFEPLRFFNVTEKWPPIRAVDHRGENIRPQLLENDERYVGGYSLKRIAGLGEEHAMILDPGEVSVSKPLHLFLSGWVYWATSNSMKALSTNRGTTIEAPSIQVRNDKGDWVTVVEDLGLPSGLHRTLIVDLTDKFLSDDRRVRVRTNLRIHWDRAFFAHAEDSDTPVVKTHELRSANLHYRGFSVPYRKGGAEAPELFDYSRRLSEAPWNAPAGPYTCFGDVSSLVESTDDRLVVMAPGDELTVSFDGESLPPLRAGWRRDFFLHLTGWAKDNNTNTAHFRTTEPLPFRGMGDYARPRNRQPDWDYLKQYQTRRVPLLVAPLPPPSIPDKTESRSRY